MCEHSAKDHHAALMPSPIRMQRHKPHKHGRPAQSSLPSSAKSNPPTKPTLPSPAHVHIHAPCTRAPPNACRHHVPRIWNPGRAFKPSTWKPHDGTAVGPPLAATIRSDGRPRAAGSACGSPIPTPAHRTHATWPMASSAELRRALPTRGKGSWPRSFQAAARDAHPTVRVFR